METPSIEGYREPIGDWPTKVEAIKGFLDAHANPFFAHLYNEKMEVQVNVAQGNGKLEMKEYRGRSFKAYTDGTRSWKPFRIPMHSMSEPEFDLTSRMSYDIGEHTLGIGMTGFNWVDKQSVYVAFDFDSIVNHSKGLSHDEMDLVFRAASDLPWTTICKSTSGKGYHIYVFIDKLFGIANHREHAAVARAILGKMSSLTGYNFTSAVDVLGGNMWVWHQKMIGTDGLTVIKEGQPLPATEIPPNWRDHIAVVSRRAARTSIRPSGVPEGEGEDIEKAVAQKNFTPLDEKHRALIARTEGTQSWWNPDHHVFITHTAVLAEAHQGLNMRGLYQTVATGSGGGADHNCFCTPLRDGAWLIRRYGKGVEEAPSWFIDASGFTACYLNRDPDLYTVCRVYGANEGEKERFFFDSLDTMAQALKHLGINVELPPNTPTRDCVVWEGKDGRVMVKFSKLGMNEALPGWILEKDKWTRIFRATAKAPFQRDIGSFDDVCRHIVGEGNSDMGWVLKVQDRFVEEPLTHVKHALTSMGHNTTDVNAIIGQSILQSWKLVMYPFEPEYPGNREWNYRAPQFKFAPLDEDEDLRYPTWTKMLNHIGRDLDVAVQSNEWCKTNGLQTGADYLMCWCASMFQFPRRQLPYLFLFGAQNSGKTVLHESLSTLFYPGYADAKQALLSEGGFNAELNNAVLAYIEETDLRANKASYNKIKEWVTGHFISLHKKNETPFLIANTTHWIHCANDPNYCPIFPGDTRIVIIQVYPIPPDQMIPRMELDTMLKAEAADFLTALLRLEVPRSPDRLNIPPIQTGIKRQMENLNKTDLQCFIEERCFNIPGQYITIENFYEAFIEYLDPQLVSKWTKQRISKEMDKVKYPKGRLTAIDKAWAYGNISFNANAPSSESWIATPASEYLRRLSDVKPETV